MKKTLLFLLFSIIAISMNGQLTYEEKNIELALTYDSLSNFFCLKIKNWSKKTMYLNKKKSPFTRGACFLLIGHESMPIGPQYRERIDFLRIPPLSTDSLIFADNSLESFFDKGIPIIEAIISVDYILLSKVRYIKDGIQYENFKRRCYKIRQVKIIGFMTF
jgi:hypothetical protein